MATQQLDLEVEEVAALAAGGDRDALGVLYETYADPLERFIRVRVGDRLLAEDLASTTWERVAKSIRSYRTMDSGFRAWLFTIARRTAAEHYRGLQRRREHLLGEFLADEYVDPGASTDELVQARMDAHHLAAAVRSLPSRQKRCVTLRFYVGLSLNDTAAVLGVKSNAVKQLQFRALNALAKQFSDDGGRRTTETVVTVATMSQPKQPAAGR